MNEIIQHPWEPFIPQGTQRLLLGSFPPLSLVESQALGEGDLAFYYGSSRNQMWKIWELLSGKPLRVSHPEDGLDKENSLDQIKATLAELHTGVADIILTCRRIRPDSSDDSLEILSYQPLNEWISRFSGIKQICFTSHFVEKHFIKAFPDLKQSVNCLRLPSSSPRARGSVQEKAQIYANLLGFTL